MTTCEKVAEKMCWSKVKLTQTDAERKAFWRGMRAYNCPLCKQWHLTKLGGALYQNKR